jgi:hypothetical protein
MTTLLQKLLKKANLKSYDDLNAEEKAYYDRLSEVLSGRRITDSEVLEFLQQEKEETTFKLINKKLNEREDIFFKVKLEMIINLQKFINSPIIEKEIAQKEVEAILESNPN